MGYKTTRKGNRTTTQNRGAGNLNKTTVRDGSPRKRKTSGVTTSLTFSNSGTYRNVTTNNAGVITRTRTKIGGSTKTPRWKKTKVKGLRRGRSSKSDPLSTLILIAAFGIFWLVATIYHGIASLFH